MPVVTVAGANGTSVGLNYDSTTNAFVASQVAGSITSGVNNGSIVPTDSTTPPAVPAGKTGEYVADTAGSSVNLTAGYKDVVINAAATVYSSTDANQNVLIGDANATFIATGGSGTVIGGGGNVVVNTPSSDSGAWTVVLGNGNDSVSVQSTGTNKVLLGTGNSAVSLGGGTNYVQTAGNDTISVGSGATTVVASGSGSDLVNGGAGKLFFLGGSGNSTVIGGSGSETVYGGKGNNSFQGGTDGNNRLYAGTGNATLFGGGNNDLLVAQGTGAQLLNAATGNETLIGAAGADTFAFTSGNAGTDLVRNFASGRDAVHLAGYGPNEAANAVASQQNTAGSTLITLSDGTKVTFQGLSSIKLSDFS
jgi:Ca2+-binding RTX toxin-like protein